MGGGLEAPNGVEILGASGSLLPLPLVLPTWPLCHLGTFPLPRYPLPRMEWGGLLGLCRGLPEP